MRRGSKHSDSSLAKIRHSCSGQGNGMCGKRHSTKTRALMRQNTLTLWTLPSFRRRMAAAKARGRAERQAQS